jgi:hypothetical protein
MLVEEAVCTGARIHRACDTIGIIAPFNVG